VPEAEVRIANAGTDGGIEDRHRRRWLYRFFALLRDYEITVN